MKETTQAHLAIFKKEALRWIKILQLDDCEVHFTRAPLSTDVAQLWCNYEGRVFTFALADEWKNTIIKLTTENIKASAKHEAIELLLTPLSFLGVQRFLTEEEYNTAREQVVRKLEKLL